MNSGPKPNNEYKLLAEQLGVTRLQVRRIGKHEARRLLQIDPESRRLVMAYFTPRSNSRPKKKTKKDTTTERMVELSGKIRRIA